MLDAAKRAAELGAGAPIDEFVPDSLLTLGLTRLVEVFCEASKQVSPSFKERHTEINWREMAGTRDRLVHAYWDVDVEVLRDIVSKTSLLSFQRSKRSSLNSRLTGNLPAPAIA